MSEREKIRAEIATLARTLDRLSSAQGELCENMITGGVAAGAYPGLAELEEVRAKADSLKRQIEAMKTKGKLDHDIIDLETELESVLTRYYWLWQKCKAGMA
jgi:hypothetical protein